MHIGIFGGTFNPPHLGHLIIAESMRDAFGLDQILWIPGYSPPHKSSSGLALPSHRLNMTRLAIAGHPSFVLSEIEIKRKGTSYTVDTLRQLVTEHPESRFSLMIGGDSLAEFLSWKNPDQIVSMANLLVYRRPKFDGTSIAERYQGRVHFSDSPLLSVSSTRIRNKMKAGQSIRYLVPEPVRHYIQTHRLYHF